MTNYVPFTKETIFKVPDSEVFRVFYLEAPISILGEKRGLSLKPNPIELNGFHTSVGFQSTNATKQYEFYLDFLSEEISFEVIFPEIVIINGYPELKWNNHSNITIGLSIERDYWTQSSYVCNITGSQLNELQNWVLDTWFPQNPIYAYFQTSIGLSRTSLFNPYLKSSICDNFCTDVFEHLQQNGVCINYVTPLNVDMSAVIIKKKSDAIVMDYNNPIDKAEIISFYGILPSVFRNLVYSSLSSFLLDLIKELNEFNSGQISRLNLAGITGELLKQSIDYLILRTYWTDNSIQYVKIYFTDIYINYIESNLKRNVVAVDLKGGLIYDDYSIGGSVCSVSNCDTVNTCVSQSKTSNVNLYSLLVILLLLLIIFFVIFFVIYFRK